MKTIVLIISNLFLITAAPVDQHHDIEARSASEENANAELQSLLIEMRDTLASANKPPIAEPPMKATGVQLQEPSPAIQTAYILNPLSPMNPPVDLRPAQQASVPQINLFISGLPQQDRTAAAELPRQTPLQHLMLANPEPIAAIQSHAQVVALPSPSILPQNAVVMPVRVPSQMYPNMVGPLQSSAFLGPQFNPYLQPVNPLGHQGFGPYPFNPQMYNPNPYNYGMPNVAISPPIIFRERGQTVSTQG